MTTTATQIHQATNEGLASATAATYEATKAAECAGADPVHWHADTSFRHTNYRHLHHQRGVSGQLSFRLLQASDLERSYWSALALGPVKHLGLSKAHGAVSSFCTFALCVQERGNEGRAFDGSSTSRNSNHSHNGMTMEKINDGHLKPAATVTNREINNQKFAVSPVVQDNNDPVWDDCQFDFPLDKGMAPDGARIGLRICVYEAATAVDRWMPQGGSRLLGAGTLDVTSLVRGETIEGKALPGVQDAWTEVTLEGQEQEEPVDGDGSTAGVAKKGDPLAQPATRTVRCSDKVTGRIRILVTYKPVGMEPQSKDICALEAACRHAGHHASCAPVLDTLTPFTILDRRGAYLLCEYRLCDGRRACVRLHRNAVFVIERQTLVDAAHNLALLPVDVALSTPVGRGVAQLVQPLAHAGAQLVMPAALSVKLVYLAARTTGLGVVSGVAALGGTLWQEGTSSLTVDHSRSGGGMNSRSAASRRNQRSSTASLRSRSAGTAKFVQL